MDTEVDLSTDNDIHQTYQQLTNRNSTVTLQIIDITSRWPGLWTPGSVYSGRVIRVTLWHHVWQTHITIKKSWITSCVDCCHIQHLCTTIDLNRSTKFITKQMYFSHFCIHWWQSKNNEIFNFLKQLITVRCHNANFRKPMHITETRQPCI